MDTSKHIWEGWTVQSFIDELEPTLDMIQNNQSWQRPVNDIKELKTWCMDNQPYYKKYIPEVVKYFSNKYKLN